MRILIAHSRYRSAAPSGENNVVDSDVALLSRAGHDVTLWERRSDEIAQWPLARRAGVPIRSIYDTEVRRSLRARLAVERPDVVHVHNTFPLLSRSVLDACRDAGVPVVATLHNYKLLCAGGDFFRDSRPCHACADGSVTAALRHRCYRDSLPATGTAVAGLVGGRATWRREPAAYLFLSAAQRDLMRGLGLPPERTFVKHNWVAPPAEAAPRTRAGVVHLGRLDAAKGARFLMAAWDRVTEPEARLTVVGGGALEGDVRAWAAGRPEVRMPGHLPPDEARAALSSSLAAVIASQWEETFGLVAVEAMAAGVAPIAPARGSFPELVTDGVDGVLYDPENPGDLAHRIEEVIRHPERYRALGRAAAATYRARFTPEVGLRRLLETYRFAQDNPRHGPPSAERSDPAAALMTGRSA